MRSLTLLATILLLFSPILQAQEIAKRPLIITVYNNATLLPGQGKLGIFGTPIHPGFSVGTAFELKEWEKSELHQRLRLGYFYHQYVQHGFQLYTETVYKKPIQNWFVEASLGLGYLQSVPATGVFELTESGTYKDQGSVLRPQFMAGAGLGFGYAIRPETTVFLQYQFYLQMPFVKEYVPLVPNSALHFGIQLPFKF